MSIVRLNDQVRWLEEQKLDDLQNWIERSLAVGDTRPLYIPTRELRIQDSMLRLYNKSSEARFRRRFRKAVVCLLRDWSDRRHTADYLRSLLVIVGGLRITEAAKLLLLYAMEERFKGQEADGQDVHRIILLAILGMRLTGGSAKVLCKRDIRDGRYAAPCFRFLYLRQPNNGMELLPIMAQHATKDPAPFAFHIVLDDLIIALGFSYFADHLGRTLGRMDASARAATLKAYQRSGRLLTPTPLYSMNLEEVEGVIIHSNPEVDKCDESKAIVMEFKIGPEVDDRQACRQRLQKEAVDKELLLPVA